MRIKSTVTVLGIVLAGAFALPASVGAQTTCVECCAGDAVCVALAELADLQATVAELVTDLHLAFSLNVKVQATTNSVLGGQYGAAINQIDAFGNQVDAAGQSGQLTVSVLNVLKTKHDTVKNSISNVR
jgi:hypothetical protein